VFGWPDRIAMVKYPWRDWNQENLLNEVRP
jgi:hypothetical protein